MDVGGALGDRHVIVVRDVERGLDAEAAPHRTGKRLLRLVVVTADKDVQVAVVPDDGGGIRPVHHTELLGRLNGHHHPDPARAQGGDLVRKVRKGGHVRKLVGEDNEIPRERMGGAGVGRRRQLVQEVVDELHTSTGFDNCAGYDGSHRRRCS